MPNKGGAYFFDDCYHADVHLIWGYSEDKACEKCMELGFEPLDPEMDYEGSVQGGESGYLVYIKEKDICTLHHECVHLAMSILTDRNISLDGEDIEEVVCSVSEMYFRKFIDKMGFKGV